MSKNRNLNNLKGSKDVLSAMALLKDTQIVAATRQAGRKAMQIVADDAQRNAQSIDDSTTSLSIADNVAIRTSYSRVTGDLVVKVGIMGGARYRRGDKEQGLTTYWRFVEFGTEHSAAQPFLRPAIDSNQAQVFVTFMNELRVSLNRRLK